MKNNEWNIPSDYFEKNKKALMPVRKFPTGKWLLALAAACVIGVGFFMVKGEGQTQDIAEGKRREEVVREVKNGEDVGAKNLSPEVREGKIENEKQNENGKEGKNGEEKVREGMSGEEKVREGMSGEEKVSEGKNREAVAQGLKEIPREELVAYLLEQDTDFIENID